MIQRIQTLYLLIVAGLLIALYFIPFAEISMLFARYPANVEIREFLYLYTYAFKGDMISSPHFFPGTIILQSLCLFLTLIIILLFKKRGLQTRLTLLLVLLLLGLSGMTIYQYQLFEAIQHSPLKINGSEFQFTTFPAGFLFAPVCIILALLALRGIRKDEKLIRSLNRLR